MNEESQELYRKVVEVSRFINATVRTVSDMEASAGPAFGSLPQVSAQLSDLTKLTEDGTHRVMGLTEEIQDGRAEATKLLDQLDGLAVQAKLDVGISDRIASIKRLLLADDKRLLDIMTALSFQDLVGQRVKKILVILDDVQRRLLEMIVLFGCKPEGNGRKEDNRAGQMLKELEASRTTALQQDLVDDILGECGYN
nr:protein phosphatase CheZ [Nitrospirota bacterium]